MATSERDVGRDVLAGARRPWTALVTLGLVDALLLVANVVHLEAIGAAEPTGRFLSGAWNGDRDGSYLELWGHAQLVGAVVLLLAVAQVRRSLVYVAWGAVCLVLDDFAQVHERLGDVLVTGLGLPGVLGLRPQDLGELLVWSGEALVLGPMVLLSTWRASRRVRLDSVVLLACVVVLAVFGVGVDQLHVALEPHLGGRLLTGLTLLESAGEILGMTLLSVAVVWTTRSWSEQR